MAVSFASLHVNEILLEWKLKAGRLWRLRVSGRWSHTLVRNKDILWCIQCVGTTMPVPWMFRHTEKKFTTQTSPLFQIKR